MEILLLALLCILRPNILSIKPRKHFLDLDLTPELEPYLLATDLTLL